MPGWGQGEGAYGLVGVDFQFHKTEEFVRWTAVLATQVREHARCRGPVHVTKPPGVDCVARALYSIRYAEPGVFTL